MGTEKLDLVRKCRRASLLTQTACTCVVIDTCPPQLRARPRSRPLPAAEEESSSCRGGPAIMFTIVVGSQGPLTLQLWPDGSIRRGSNNYGSPGLQMCGPVRCKCEVGTLTLTSFLFQHVLFRRTRKIAFQNLRPLNSRGLFCRTV